MIYVVTSIKLIVQQTCQEIVYLLFLVKSESKIYQTNDRCEAADT